MKKCPKCNANMANDAKFCMRCGSPLPQMEVRSQAQIENVNHSGIPPISTSSESKKYGKIKFFIAIAVVIAAAIGSFYYMRPVSAGADYQKAMEYMKTDDLINAKIWLQKGVDKGDPEAMYALANLYVKVFELCRADDSLTLEEKGIDVDSLLDAVDGEISIGSEQVFKLYEMAANKGHAKSMYALGFHNLGEYDAMMGRDILAARKWLKKAIENGYDDGETMRELAFAYADMDEDTNTSPNYEEAFKWYQKAADKGNADAMISLGDFYQNGISVEQNLDEAIAWYERAKDAGYSKTAVADYIKEANRLRSFPNTIEDLPEHALKLCRKSNINDFPADEGYANLETALNKFFAPNKADWRSNNQLNLVTPHGLMRYWGWVSPSKFQMKNEINSCLALNDDTPFSKMCPFPTMVMARVDCIGVAKNIYNPTQNARYELIFLLTMYSKFKCEFTVDVKMNGEIIEGSDFWSAVYLN